MAAIFRTIEQVEDEIVRRITVHHARQLRDEQGYGASVRSKAKAGARAQELSDLLGWLRGRL